MWRFWNEPISGIGPSAYLIQTPAGNMGFEGCPVFSQAALDHIAALGGMAVLSASHPHAYGALWQLQDRFDPELALHPGDLAWSGALRVSWPWDEMLEPLPGLELHLTAGHFDGHTVLFDRPRGILFCGDALKFELAAGDPRRALTISAHKAFVRGIPLTPSELRRYRDVFARLPLHPDLDAVRAGAQQRPGRSAGPDRRHAGDPAARLPRAARQVGRWTPARAIAMSAGSGTGGRAV